MSTFKSLVYNSNNDNLITEVKTDNTDKLPSGDVLIKVNYSTINSYDVLYSLPENNNIFPQKKYPYTGGIDAAGVVVESNSNLYRPGDEVLVFGYGLGMTVPGGYGEYIRVPESWIFNVPTGLSLKDCITLGTDGISAAIAVTEVLISEEKPKDKEIVVTGASAGVGLFSTAILNLLGYKVTAVTLKHEYKDFLMGIGASEVLSIDEFVATSEKKYSNKFIGAIDTIGGNVLTSIAKILPKNSTIAVSSSVLSSNATIPIMSLICNGINIIGIESITCSDVIKRQALYKLAGDWYIKQLPLLCNEISIFEIEKYVGIIKNGELRGRVIINHEI